ncbi:murein hydrolase activator EnvC family protein [Turicibacter sanguinis]|uniref:murein hydrolase activator EnvC family protein n=1 Tax=Turicibacter sanguinis TaxID=154288 RepID=UPI00241D8240|nr:M23 family metallopeptidase [Turicibacter sanguinis]
MVKKLLISLTVLTALHFSPKQNLTAEATTTCTTTEECDALINQAQSQISDIKNQQNDAQQELNAVQEDIGAILDKISMTENAISSYMQQIKQKESEISTSENQIEQLEGQISELKEIVGERARVSQRLSRTNTILEVISQSTSIVDFIKNLRVVTHFAESDAEAMDQLKSLVSEQQNLLSSLKVQKEELAASKASLEQERVNLEAYEEKLQSQKAAIAKQIQELESERLSQAEIIAIAEEQKNLLVSQTSGGFIIPLKTGYVSCEFMCYSNHTGIDLGNSGDTSTPVLAAASGTVIRSGWHAAYGWHVMISHNMDGKIITTVYAHMHSKPLVSVGQQINQGTQLGTMGNTGNSFGAHLHFEMYDGYYNYPYAVNPRKYINFPSRW